MNKAKISFLLFISFLASMQAQNAIPAISPLSAANDFIKSLTPIQAQEALKPFDGTERYYWDFVPRTDRTGVIMRSLSDAQIGKFLKLLVATAGETTLKTFNDIRANELILGKIEGRPDTNTHRDPKKYFIQIFGFNDNDQIWGWKVEGHHCCLNYTLDGNKVISATPNIACSNPAVVLSGPLKDKVLLPTERDLAKSLLVSLSSEQKSKAIVSPETPKEIINYLKRKALMDDYPGLSFRELTKDQQSRLKAIVNYYVMRSSKFFVKDIEGRIEKAGWDKVSFAWLGSEDITPGHTHYYRIQGPEFVIEYDNYQNDGNHVHSIFRDVKNDFGDALVEHYQKEHKE
ncbi:MAG: DUF3500 domain-containing protein [Saprospiraceae bacterium]